jgi:oligopeptide transport system substrate-binding protein
MEDFMKHKWIAILVLLGLLLNSGIALAHEDHSLSLPASLTAISPSTVRIATPEPTSIDPAKATDFTITNQLFSGLTRIDPVTNAPIPDLASSWSMSPGATQFTFTLRTGIKWSNGTPIMANDIKYGILRSLNPATESDYAYVLFAIQNAAEYNNGTISDPNQVGVTVLNSTQVKFTLESPVSNFPAVLAVPPARPVPATTIATWGTAWTEASHIVTSGPYRLTEWVHNDHMLLGKYTSFYDASNVRIENVSVKLVNEMTAWNLFLDDDLDTITVPLSVLSAVQADPTLSPLLHYANTPCTYYYGFSTSQPPFDDPLVRKAFIAAANRQGLIDTVLGGYQQPAQTFAPPSIFGHVDGSSEGIGIPYNPSQAQQWLSDAGYPNGAGLPPVTLWFNDSTGHQSIAEYIRQNWITNLNVTVTLQSLEWEDYVAQIDNGDFQIWRLGWCMDYNDAYNFLYDAVVPNPGRYGGWSNATYLNLLNQAMLTNDNATRRLYYKQAEEILVETDAVMLPLYFYTTPVITQAYLQRPYTSQDIHIRDWYSTPIIRGNAGVAGVILSYVDGTARTVTSQADGSYSFQVSSGWNGMVTPSHVCYMFSPSSREYINVSLDQTAQDYTATLNPASGCADVDLLIGGANRGNYGVPSGGQQRVEYALDSGPVKVVSTNGKPIIAALRDSWKDNSTSTWTSFVQMMGLPKEQLSDTYYFPSYNNVSLSGQLRFGNVDTTGTWVRVVIGGVERGRYYLDPSEQQRVEYALDSGPVVIESETAGVQIIAALRDSWWDGKRWTSFSQMMGLPKEQLSDSYYFPSYNNISLSEQLRFGNVDTVGTWVRVVIGGVERGRYFLDPSEQARVEYDLDSGPVVIESETAGVKIIAALRDAWHDGVSWTSFVQMMGLPKESLSDTYYLPAYNNISLSGQLRFGNVDTVGTWVRVVIGDVERGRYFLNPSEQQRVEYDLDSGPVVIESETAGVKIIAALRDAWYDGKRWTSFAQLMGLTALSDTYYFPSYNNISLSGQLRFGVP